MSRTNASGRRLILVTGEVGSGKTSFARRLVREERRDGRSVGGVVSEKRPCGRTSDGLSLWCYEFVDLVEGKRMQYARPRNSAEDMPFARTSDNLATGDGRAADGLVSSDRRPAEEFASGRFVFSEAGFEFAVRVLDTARDRDVVVVDEIGPVEMRGGGLWSITRSLLEDSDADMILCARERLLPRLTEQLPAGVTPIEIHTATLGHGNRQPTLEREHGCGRTAFGG